MMFLRAQTLSEGHSGVRPEVIELVLEMLNRGVHPVIPEKGSVGASGDAAPLAHLALGMIGEGQVEFEVKPWPRWTQCPGPRFDHSFSKPKKGSLVNGTQAMAAVGSLALLAAEHLCRLADIAGSMTLEGLRGIPKAFDDRIQAIRPHPGQATSAANLRRMLEVQAAQVATAQTAFKTPTPFAACLRCMEQPETR